MLTIASVSFKSEKYLSLNWQVVSKRCSSFKWLVVDNSDDLKSDKFVKLPSVPMPEETGNKVNKHSHHHAGGLNSLMKHIDTRYVLLLDPDFYLFLDLDNLLDYCDERKLAFFGAPYFPSRNKKPIMDFPVAFCMLIDTSLVDVQSFDFMPPKIDGEFWYDTGYEVYAKYRNLSKYEILSPGPGDKMFDRYTWKKNGVAIHCHAKCHIGNDRFSQHQSIVQSYDSTIQSI